MRRALNRLSTFSAASMLALSLGAAPVLAEAEAGIYLSARAAAAANDFDAAATYYMRALVADPTNLDLMESAMTALVALGRFEQAQDVAGLMQELDGATQIANMLLASEKIMTDDFEGLISDLSDAEVVGPLVDGLLLAWSQVGTGRITQAIDQFDVVAESEGLRAFALYHKALALALVGDFEGADDIFAGRSDGVLQPTRRGMIAHVEILSQLERNADATALMDRVFAGTSDATLRDMRARLVAGEMLPFTHVTKPADGAAEVFFTVGSALQGEAADQYALVYARAALALRPDHINAILLSAELLEELERYDLANQTYDLVPRDSPAYLEAELGRADALRFAGKSDTAIEVLTQLSESHADVPAVFSALGNLLNREDDFDGATKAFDKAIALYAEIGPAQWFLFYARGISHERSDRWDKAEADFRRALDLNPGQPQVLNYLGYSLVEKNIKLDEALSMIEQAVQASPDSGYILDSLGWVLYRLGRFSEAVGPMEEAVELMATDPVVNDHLGDVYWAVGRRVEAAFQWNRALSFDPEDEESIRIRRKLEVGLDVVRAEEGKEPIALVSQDG